MVAVPVRRILRCLVAAALVALPSAVRAQSARPQNQFLDLFAASATSDAAMAAYRRALAEYLEAWASYSASADAYWSAISEKRHVRSGKRAGHEPLSLDDYVLTQPPVYTGPPRPRDPSKPQEPPQPPPYVPVVADFLDSARREFKFVPRLPKDESEYKRAYARVALAAGLNRDQIVRISAFEAGGNGTYDVEAGLEYNRRRGRLPRRSATTSCSRPIPSRSLPRAAIMWLAVCWPQLRPCRAPSAPRWKAKSASSAG